MSRLLAPRSVALDEAVEAFARWRATRTQQTGPTPEALRRLAVALLATARRTPVARALSIDPSSLGRWAEQDAQATPAAPLAATATAPRFVTLPHVPDALSPAAGTALAARPELVLRWPGGAELVARGPVPRTTLAALLDAIATPDPERPR